MPIVFFSLNLHEASASPHNLGSVYSAKEFGMEPITSLSELVAWTWPVVASGVVGNAAYDGVKVLFGHKFDELQAYAEEDKEETFKAVLKTALDYNQAMAEQLAALAVQYPHSASASMVTNKIVGNITTGDITAGGNVRIGNSIKHNLKVEETD